MKRFVIAGIVLATSAACIHQARPFDRYIDQRDWQAAAVAFDADSTLLADDRSLYRAALLFGSPGRTTYNPARADSLLRRLLALFPNSRYRADASDRLETTTALLRARDSSAARQRSIEAKIADLTEGVRRLRATLDSTTAQNDSLRRNAARLESDLRDHDDQLRALRLELQQLKEIDLKRTTPGAKKPPA